MSGDRDGSDVVAKAMEGDEEAFRVLVAQHRDRVFRIALHTLGDDHEAEDLTQEVMLRLYRSLPGFRREAELSTWLYRVTVNLCRDQLRARGRMAAQPIDETGQQEALNVESHPGRAVDRERARAAVRAALTRLPEEQREAVLLRYMADLPYAEIARVTGTPQGTVASRVFRALRGLGELVERRHLEGIS